MKILFSISLICVTLLCGCTAVPTDMFPKFTWYWSADAKAYRLTQQQSENSYKTYQAAQTNNVPSK